MVCIWTSRRVAVGSDRGSFAMFERNATNPKAQSHHFNCRKDMALPQSVTLDDSVTRPYAQENQPENKKEKNISEAAEVCHQNRQSHQARNTSYDMGPPPLPYATTQSPNRRVYSPDDPVLSYEKHLRLVACDVLVLLYAARTRVGHMTRRGAMPGDVARQIERDLASITALLQPSPQTPQVRSTRVKKPQTTTPTPNLFSATGANTRQPVRSNAPTHLAPPPP